MAINLTDIQKSSLFKSLATKTFYDVGIEYGFDKHYKTPASIKAAVYSIYRKVLGDPEKYSVHPETMELVNNAVKERGVAHSIPSHKPSVAEQNEDPDIKTLILSNRDIANRLINKKLKEMDKSKKALRNESIVSLGKIFGILFDKSQIIQGQATEHVALMGKIDGNLKPEDAIELVLRMREREITKE